MSNMQLPHLTPSQSSRPIIPAGSHPARIYSMIHIGQIRETYNGQSKDMNIIRITFETPVMHEFQDGVKPLVISKDYTMSWSLSPNKSGLATLFTSAFPGRQFPEMPNVFELLNTWVMVNIEHKPKADGSFNENLASVAPVYNGIPLPQPFNPVQFFLWNPGFYDQCRTTLQAQSNWILSRMAKSKEFQEARAKGSMPQDMIQTLLTGAQEYASKSSQNAQGQAQAQQPYQAPAQTPQYHQNTAYQMAPAAAAPQQQYQQPQQQYSAPAQQATAPVQQPYQAPAQQPQYAQQPATQPVQQQAQAPSAPAPFIPEVDSEDDLPF